MTADELRGLASRRRAAAASRRLAGSDLVIVARTCSGVLDVVPQRSRAAWKCRAASGFVAAIEARRHRLQTVVSMVRSIADEMVAEADELVEEARRLEVAADALEMTTASALAS